MKKLTTLMSLCILSGSALAHDLVPGKKQEQAILITNATLHTVTQGTQENTDILLLDGKIKNIGKGLNIKTSRTIDGTGKHVYPGLIGMVTNLGMVEVDAVRATRDVAEVGNITPEVKAHIAYNTDSEITPTIRSNGVTHVQVTPQGSGLRGQSSLVQLDAWNWQDALVKEQTGMHMSWPSMNINKAPWEKRSAEKQREAQQKALSAIDEAFTAIKAYHKARNADKKTPVDLRWEAMRPVLDGTMPLYIRADEFRQIEAAVHFAKKQGMKLVIVGGRDAWQAIDLLKQSKTPVIFTAAWGLPSRSDEGIDQVFNVPAELAKAGIPYALAVRGSWQVRDLPFAAGQSVAYGVDKEQALASITLAPAKMLGVDDQLGSLEVGKNAT